MIVFTKVCAGQDIEPGIPDSSVSRATDCVRQPNPEVIKLLSCSVEHDILNAQKYENIKKLSIFQAQISLKCYCSCP